MFVQECIGYHNIASKGGVQRVEIGIPLTHWHALTADPRPLVRRTSVSFSGCETSQDEN